MKHLITTIFALMLTIGAMAQATMKFAIDESSLSVIGHSLSSSDHAYDIAPDAKRRPCARIHLHIGNMTQNEIKGLVVETTDGDVHITRREVSTRGDEIIVELTAKRQTHICLYHSKFGFTKSATLSLSGNKEYRLNAGLSYEASITLLSNTREAKVYINDIYKGDIGEDGTLAIANPRRGENVVRLEYGEYKTEQTLTIDELNNIYHVDIEYLTTTPQVVQFSVHPARATINIDGINYSTNENGLLTLEMPNGPHKYKVTAEDYYSEEGVFLLNGERFDKDIQLRARHGWLTVPATACLEDASVYIDNKWVGETPISRYKLDKGEHSIKIKSGYYKEHTEFIAIEENEETSFEVELTPIFADITITSSADALIYIDGTFKGLGSWSGRCLYGSHIFEARKESHRTTSLDVTIDELTTKKAYTLDAPEPIYGTLKVTSRPSRANVYVNGSYAGKTPYNATKLIGDYNVAVYKKNRNSATGRFAHIYEGKTSTITCKLSYSPSHPYYTWERVSFGIMTDVACAVYDDNIFALGVGFYARMWNFNSWLVPVVGVRYMLGFDGSCAFGFPLSLNFNFFRNYTSDMSFYTGLGVDPMCLIYDGVEWDCPITWNIVGYGTEHFDVHTYLNFGFTIPDNLVWGVRLTYYF